MNGITDNTDTPLDEIDVVKAEKIEVNGWSFAGLCPATGERALRPGLAILLYTDNGDKAVEIDSMEKALAFRDGLDKTINRITRELAKH
jgi:hypothetical protein